MNREYTPENITELPENGIFVFGSNTEGRHGRGAALTARLKFGAIYGKASKLQGRSYAIITKDLKKGLKSIPLLFIKFQLNDLCLFAEQNADKVFYVTKLGSSLAGYSIEEIKELFESLEQVPDNIILPKEYEFRD